MGVSRLPEGIQPASASLTPSPTGPNGERYSRLVLVFLPRPYDYRTNGSANVWRDLVSGEGKVRVARVIHRRRLPLIDSIAGPG